jgi:DNA primase
VHQRPKPQDLTIDTIHRRLKKTGDLWEKMRKHKGANLLSAIDKLRK